LPSAVDLALGKVYEFAEFPNPWHSATFFFVFCLLIHYKGLSKFV